MHTSLVTPSLLLLLLASLPPPLASYFPLCTPQHPPPKPSPPPPPPSCPPPPPSSPSVPPPPPSSPHPPPPPPPATPPCPPPSPPSTPPSPPPSPPPPPPSPVNTSCVANAMQMGLCVDVLAGLIHVGIGPEVKPFCCPTIVPMTGLEAAVCMCNIITARLFSLNLLFPMATRLIVYCGKTLPPSYTCSPQT